ncbi:MAG: hypothetical protein LBI27_03850 [Clostridiales bacterium]|nr:hypothetical protein [Clostridiales bacterium]
MQAQAYDGYFENGQFFPKIEPLNLSGRVRAILTIIPEESSEMLDYSSLSQEQFNIEMEKGLADLNANRVVSSEQVRKNMQRKYGA